MNTECRNETNLRCFIFGHSVFLKIRRQNGNIKMKNKYGTLLIIAAASLWGTAGIFVRELQNVGVYGMQIVLARALFSSVILALLIFIKDRSLFKIKLCDIWIFACTGLFSIVMFNFCYYKTMELSTLSVAAVLLYTAPFFVVIMSAIFFKEKLTVRKCVACVCAFIGCAFVSGAFSSEQRLSAECLIYGLLTGFGYSLYTVFGNMLIKRGYDSLTITFYTFVFALFGCIFLANPITSLPVIFKPRALMVALLMATLNTVMPYILYTNGLRSVESGRAPIIATVEPVVATLLGAIVYSETLNIHGIIGISLVIGSVIVLNLNLRIKRNED